MNMNKEARNKTPIPLGPVMKPQLTRSTLPWLLFLDIGVNREGYFTWEKFYIQLEDLLDCLEVMYPKHQICIELDWSGCHGKKSKDALNANSMNLGPAKPDQPDKSVFPDTELRREDLGDSPCYDNLVRKVVDGEEVFVQSFRFKEADKVLVKAKEGISVVGCGKGIKQILMERGLWQNSFRSQAPVIDGIRRFDLCAKNVLSACSDFANAKTMLQEFIEKRGEQFKVRKTPICHPEIAGVGIEYAWGLAKKTYKRLAERLNNVKGCNKHQARHVSKCLSLVSLEHGRRFSGKAHEYKMAYLNGPDGPRSHVDIEANAKKMKQHRDCGRMEASFILQVATDLNLQQLPYACTCHLCNP